MSISSAIRSAMNRNYAILVAYVRLDLPIVTPVTISHVFPFRSCNILNYKKHIHMDSVSTPSQELDLSYTHMIFLVKRLFKDLGLFHRFQRRSRVGVLGLRGEDDHRVGCVSGRFSSVCQC
jgi:hypothetical protein